MLSPPRHAATIILIRDGEEGPRILMGQRGTGASFMPSKFVFPGGAVDPSDRALAPYFSADPVDEARLSARSDDTLTPAALALAAVRETWEETGLPLAVSDPSMTRFADNEDPHWASFFGAGYRPVTERLTFIFRAITPPTRTKRFDARFFLADASLILGDPDDISRASGELSHLKWLSLVDARALDLPFITEVVLAEVEARLSAPETPRPTPFFHHDEGRSYLDHL